VRFADKLTLALGVQGVDCCDYIDVVTAISNSTVSGRGRKTFTRTDTLKQHGTERTTQEQKAIKYEYATR
jgi:hypothetical protein